MIIVAASCSNAASSTSFVGEAYKGVVAAAEEYIPNVLILEDALDQGSKWQPPRRSSKPKSPVKFDRIRRREAFIPGG